MEGRADGVIQAERPIPVPPLISHPRVLLKNQCQDIQELQPGPEVQRAPTALNNHGVRLGTLKLPFAVVRERVLKRSGLFERLQVGLNCMRLPDALGAKANLNTS